MNQLQQDAKAAYDLISDESRWTTGLHARDAMGVVCDPLGENAVCWCAWGAIYKVTGRRDSRHLALERALSLAAGVPNMQSVAQLNDGVFDCASVKNGRERILNAFKLIAEGP
jgi:hypothetical protein